jgi:hypothetical protein
VFAVVTGQTVAAQLPPEALPSEVVYLLLHRVGVAEDEITAMSNEQAIARLNLYWSSGG